MIRIDAKVSPQSLLRPIDQLFELSARKIALVEKAWDPSAGTPVFTAAGRYTSRGWTEWTQGFQFGSAILQFDATDDPKMLDLGRRNTVRHMASHVSHVGVHDHGFNNVSTYGNLLRLAREGRVAADEWELAFYELALKLSGAVQAARWTELPGGLGYIRSFNGPHSLFADTMRSLRSLALGHQLGHALMGERDRRISLLQRLVQHADTNARYNVYYGEGRDAYDVRGRVAHESMFNLNDGSYRCPSSQQGYSPFTTWTRGLAWVLTGYAEQLEFLDTLKDAELKPFGGRKAVSGRYLAAARATADFYIEFTPTCGVPVLGYRRARARAPGQLSRPAGGPVQRSRAGGQLGGRDRGAGAHPARQLSRGARRVARRQAVRRGRPDDGEDAVRGAVPVDRAEAPGPAAALGLSPSQRLGSCAEGTEDSVRRIVDVG